MNKNVLIVDDIEFIIEFEKNLFDAVARSSGCAISTTEAGTAQEAYDKIKNATFDLMVLDINLPDGTGIELAKFAKEKDPSVRIAMLSISPLDYENQKEHFDAFLKKPILPDAFKKTVKQLLKL
jgi:CheY-like chemotaxis protein